MDRMTVLVKAKVLFDKYKYVALVLLLGVFLMMLPGSKEEDEPVNINEPQQQCDLSSELENILSNIEGVGRVDVLLTQSKGAETIYQTDEDRNISSDSESIRTETVIISGTDRGEYGLVRQENPPGYRGALIVCEGADRPSVRLAVVEAVASITGIPSDRITVLKMK